MLTATIPAPAPATIQLPPTGSTVIPNPNAADGASAIVPQVIGGYGPPTAPPPDTALEAIWNDHNIGGEQWWWNSKTQAWSAAP